MSMPTMTEIKTTEAELSDQASTGSTAWLVEHERFMDELSPDQPAAVQALRRQGIESFAALGFPTLQQEAWRLTNVAAIARGRFVRPEAGPASSGEIEPEEILPHTFAAAAQLVFVDGRFAPALSHRNGLPAEVLAGSLAEALARWPAEVTPHLGGVGFAASGVNPFVALNTAFLSDGAFVKVPRGVAVAGPIHLLFLASEADEDREGMTVSFPRNLIVAGETSQVTVVETYAGTGAYFTCAVTELITGPGAVVDHCKVQRESREAFHIATFQILAERGSVPSSHSISIGGGLVRNDINAVLAGEGVDCILNGLYLAEGRQHVDTHMRVEHAAAHCASHELYKGVLDGKARAVFDGLIYVHKGAQKTDAKQSNRNLLLSRDAIANSNPQLEIFADDVKCTHGSTVGQLDDDAIFYLRSRGIGEEAARSLLTYAFASDVVERIKVEPVRRDLEELLFARLPQGEVVRQAV
jgi:Fe-S cluster assembly protein SufD